MPSDPPLTDEEISVKYGIPRGHKSFSTARKLSRSRADRIICEVPVMMCPHCGHKFTATFQDLGSNDPANGDEIPCEGCDRIIYIEHIAEPENGDEEGDVYVTLNTDPEPSR